MHKPYHQIAQRTHRVNFYIILKKGWALQHVKIKVKLCWRAHDSYVMFVWNMILFY